MRVSVIGCGYLGAVHAAGMAGLGHDVIGLDVDEAKVAQLQRGEAPFHEPGFPESLRTGLDSGRLQFTTDPRDVADCEVHFLSVGTPQKATSYAADLSHLWAALESLLRIVPPRPHGRPILIVGKSTVPVGTARAMCDRVASSGVDGVVAWNPEFLREGFAVQDTTAPDRLVYGLPDDRHEREYAQRILDEVYAPILATGTPRLLVNYPTAELVKVAANSFLATKISFINSMAELCDASGADVTRLAEAIGHDPRIGPGFLNAGIGFGGGCLPKDIRAFMARAGELGVDQALTFLREVDSINLRRRDHAVELATTMLGGSLIGSRIAVLGLTFKPNSDDIRDSPALDIAGRLSGHGAEVVATDPAAAQAVRELRPDLHIVDTAEEALEQADLVMVLTEWSAYLTLDPAESKTLVGQAKVIDGRNALDAAAWADAGWDYRGMGRVASAW